MEVKDNGAMALVQVLESSGASPERRTSLGFSSSYQQLIPLIEWFLAACYLSVLAWKYHLLAHTY